MSYPPLRFSKMGFAAQVVEVPLDPTFADDGTVRLSASQMSDLSDVEVLHVQVYASGADTDSSPAAVLAVR